MFGYMKDSLGMGPLKAVLRPGREVSTRHGKHNVMYQHLPKARITCLDVAGYYRDSTVKAVAIDWCAMQSRIPYFGKGAKILQTKDRLSPSERQKNKKTPDPTRGATSTT